MVNRLFLLVSLIGTMTLMSCEKDTNDIVKNENPSINNNKNNSSSENGEEDGTSSGGSDINPSNKVIVETGDIEPESCMAEAYGKVSGVNEIVEVGFLFGGTTNLSFENGSNFVYSNSRDIFKIKIKGLVDDCVNYYRAYALVHGQFYYGEVKSCITKQLTYVINDKIFKMVKVEGGPQGDYSIMQTEMPIDGKFDICGIHVPYDGNNGAEDGFINKAEMRAYINQLREITGLEFRLPTVDEWYYAAVGGKYSKGYEYSGSDNIDEVAWYLGNSGGKAHPVAQKKANELEIYDMSGNYSEVVQQPEEDYDYIDGPLYGGNYTKGESECRCSCFYPGNRGTYKITGSNMKHLNAIDKMETIRLVYSRY